VHLSESLALLKSVMVTMTAAPVAEGRRQIPPTLTYNPDMPDVKPHSTRWRVDWRGYTIEPGHPGRATMAISASDIAFLRDAIDESGLGAATELILASAEPCFRIFADGDATSAPPGATRFGGVPDLPDSVAWPRDEAGRFGNFFAQFDFAALARRIDAPDLPREGMLSLFATYIFAAAEPVGVKALLSPAGSQLMRADRPTADELVFPPAGLSNPVFIRFEASFSLPLHSREFQRAIAAVAPDGDIADFEIILEELRMGGPIGQLLGFASPYNHTDFYRKLYFHRIGRGGYEYQDYWDSMEEYQAVLVRSHPELAERRRQRFDEAKLRWLFDHRKEIRAETARWRLFLRIDSNRAMNFNIADSDSIYFFISSAALAKRDFSRMEAGFTQG